MPDPSNMRWAFGLLAICLAMVRSNPQQGLTPQLQPVRSNFQLAQQAQRLEQKFDCACPQQDQQQFQYQQRPQLIQQQLSFSQQRPQPNQQQFSFNQPQLQNIPQQFQVGCTTPTRSVVVRPTTVVRTVTQTVTQTVAGSELCWTGSCPINFERIGNCCYYFSVANKQDKRNWQDAKDACKALGLEHNGDIDLYEVGTGGCTGDVNLMIRIADKRAYTWSGAKSVDSGATWEWERTGEPVPNNSNMWWHQDPRTEDGNCMVAFTTSWTTERAYFGVAPCDTQMNDYVCQIFK